VRLLNRSAFHKLFATQIKRISELYDIRTDGRRAPIDLKPQFEAVLPEMAPHPNSECGKESPYNTRVPGLDYGPDNRLLPNFKPRIPETVDDLDVGPRIPDRQIIELE
jgi:hypothetical protein